MQYDPVQLSSEIISKAKYLGFDDCGIARVESLDNCKNYYQKWINEGRHGLMSFLERHVDKRLNPALLVENAKSVIVVILNYNPSAVQNTGSPYKISKYAYGKDYHRVLKKKLRFLKEFIDNRAGPANSRYFVDSAPVMERQWAQKAGLGRTGKNTLLLHPQLGSFIFIGEIITELELKYNENNINEPCGHCRACLIACPTTALNPDSPYQLDASKCISYHTIENHDKEDFPPENDRWIFGCDICQDVCPKNRKIPETAESAFTINPFIREAQAAGWENLTKLSFDTIFAGSPLKRARYEGVKKNINWIKKQW